jgi:hypothetical protein
LQGTKSDQNKYNSLLSDLRIYFLTKPKINTLVEYNSPEERENYSQRILQRIGVPVNDYSVLNIHRIGIDVPVKYVFEELLQWDGNSDYWPNQLARVKRINGSLKKILIYTLGIEKIRLKRLLSKGIKIKPLFNMYALKFQYTPPPSDTDNARYLLYECSGGYPIGIFTLYVRSSIVEQNELEKAQLFSLVAFNFYGRKNWFYSEIINPIWTKIHNRVTSNVLNRMKSEFENKFMTQVIKLNNNTKKLENIEL